MTAWGVIVDGLGDISSSTNQERIDAIGKQIVGHFLRPKMIPQRQQK